MSSVTRRSRFLLFVTIVAAGTAVGARQAQSPPKPPPQADPHAQMNARGAHVMGFDQDKTTHHFLLFEDGGAIDVSVKDKSDTKNRDAIRAHLPHTSMMFAEGDFSAPMLVHATDVPGTKELAALKDTVKYSYVETPTGGRVDIKTNDRAALEAVYTFLRYQIADHKTGDTGKVEKRR